MLLRHKMAENFKILSEYLLNPAYTQVEICITFQSVPISFLVYFNVYIQKINYSKRWVFQRYAYQKDNSQSFQT